METEQKMVKWLPKAHILATLYGQIFFKHSLEKGEETISLSCKCMKCSKEITEEYTIEFDPAICEDSESPPYLIHDFTPVCVACIEEIKKLTTQIFDLDGSWFAPEVLAKLNSHEEDQEKQKISKTAPILMMEK